MSRTVDNSSSDKVERAIEQSLFASFEPEAQGAEGKITAMPSEVLDDSDSEDFISSSELGRPEAIDLEAGKQTNSSAEVLSDRVLAPMLQHYCYVKKQYPEHLLLFQVVDFYDVFFDDAKLSAE